MTNTSKMIKTWSILIFLSILFALFSIPVSALGTPQIVSINPSSPSTVGTCITVRVKINWDSEYRAMRIRFENSGWQESSEVEFERTFCTDGYAAGTYTIRVEADRIGGNWSNPAATETSYQLVAPQNPTCSITSFSASPSSPQQVGTSISISGSASCSTGVRAIRFKVDGGIIYEIGASSGTASWNTSGVSAGTHTLTIEAAGIGDNNWTFLSSQSMSFSLNSTPQNPSCSITSLSTSPSSPQQVGTSVNISGSASCTTGVRAIRFKVDGGIIYEIGAPTGTATWNTSGVSVGTHTLTLEAAGVGDNDWIYLASQSMSFTLSSGFQPTQPPSTISCTITNFGFNPPSPQSPGTGILITATASCNTGVRAIRIKIGGGIQYEIGAPSVSWTWNTSGWAIGSYSVTVEAAGLGDNDWSQAASQTSTYRIEQSTSTSAPVVNSFSTGDVIQIGYDVYVIVNGQRRLVPNPATLDALGIPRSWINNEGFSDADLLTIPRGADVPDVNRDLAGFNTFKQTYFPNTVPIIPTTSTPGYIPSIGTSTPQLPPLTPSTPIESPASFANAGDGYDPGQGSSWLDVQASSAQALFTSGQCTWFVAGKREDLELWIGQPPRHAYLWNDRAQANGGQFGVYVDSNPRAGDIAVWEAGCAGADSSWGHVAYVTWVSSDDNSFKVEEVNWNRFDPVIPAEGCMSFIHPPSGSTDTQPQNTDNEADFQCTAPVEAIDEGGGTFFDRNYFLYVWLPDPIPTGEYSITFRGLFWTRELNLALWDDAGDYLRYGISTSFAYLNPFTWKDSPRWEFQYKCR